MFAERCSLLCCGVLCCLWCWLMQVNYSEKKQALLDLLSVYAAGGKAIVFTRTKMGADEVAAAISQQQVCEALHGDIPQNQREKTLGRFRAGAHRTLTTHAALLSTCCLHADMCAIADMGAIASGPLLRSATPTPLYSSSGSCLSHAGL